MIEFFTEDVFYGADMEKKYFVKIVTSLVTVLLKMILCLFKYFAFTKKTPLF